MQLQHAHNVIVNVLLVKLQQKTVLNVQVEETLYQTVFVMMELMITMVSVNHVPLNVQLVILFTIVLNVLQEEKKSHHVLVKMELMM